ncbi:MAG: hypothetical protein EHM23_26560 [Acidobacteria bacterium]|nr:MAG: hypothetical protein EHM23_26560 [Acidobacteriota bacterium]
MAEDGTLHSWKEISRYLGVSVRAAQTWERDHGLPVNRYPGSRGRVWASVPQLDAWRQEFIGRRPESSDTVGRVSARHRLVRGGLVVVLAACLVGAGFAWLHLGESGRVPASWRLEHDLFVVLDANLAPLWSYKAKERTHGLNEFPAGLAPLICDLDGDRIPEVVYPELGERESAVYCFGHDGRMRWRFVPGRAVATRKERFAQRYSIVALRVVRLPGRTCLLVVATHHPFYPCQVTLVSARGQVLSEYWHAGHLRLVDIFDLDGDGKEEIVLSGISNAYKRGTVVALDPLHVQGAAAEEDPAYQLIGFPPAHEKTRVLLPRTCIGRRLREFNKAVLVEKLPSRVVVTCTEFPGGRSEDVQTLTYFSPDMKHILSVEPAFEFRAMHRTLETQGILDHPFSPTCFDSPPHLAD